MIDCTTKLTLIAIAAGLWANALIPILAPKAAHAQDDDSSTISNMASDVSDIALDVENISRGTCLNDNICK